MAKKVTQQPNNKPPHLFWYIFPGEKTSSRIKEGDIPTPPFKRFDTPGEANGYIMTEIENYCCGAKTMKEDGCPQRFNCQLYSNFHKLATTGKFRSMYMGDIFKDAPYGEDKAKQFVCDAFKIKE